MQVESKRRCPFLETPFEDCYVMTLSSNAIDKAISYCGADFEKCEIYAQRIGVEEAKRERMARAPVLKALLVEDNERFRRLLKDFLSDRYPFMRIEEAGDGDEALRKVRASLPDLIFMDIQLPGENGLAVTRRIMSAFPQTNVIVLTNHDLPDYRRAALDSGAIMFITKGSLTGEKIARVIEIVSKGGDVGALAPGVHDQ